MTEWQSDLENNLKLSALNLLIVSKNCRYHRQNDKSFFIDSFVNDYSMPNYLICTKLVLLDKYDSSLCRNLHRLELSLCIP